MELLNRQDDSVPQHLNCALNEPERQFEKLGTLI